MVTVPYQLAAAAAAAALGALLLFRLKRLRRMVKRRSRLDRDQLWERIHGSDWGDLTTSNYGFAPAEGEGPERFQHQMYLELVKLAAASGRIQAETSLLEVSCGRGGGLAHLVAHWPGPVRAVGIDIAPSAIRACRRSFSHLANLRFTEGNALSLPFGDGSFDAVVNVEASNDYRDFDGFFAEVARVLRPGGLFLYADS